MFSLWMTVKGIILSGAKFTKLRDVLEACHEIPDAATVSGEANQSMTDKSEGDEYMGFKPETILSLQRQWRRVFSRIHEHRHRQETPHGQIFLPVQRLCSTIFNGGHGIKCFFAVEKVHFRAFLFTDRVRVLDIDNASKGIQTLRATWNAAISQLLPASELEELGNFIPQIGHVKFKLINLTKTCSINGLEKLIWLTNPEDLNLKGCEAGRGFRSIRHEMDVSWNVVIFFFLINVFR